MRNLKKLNDKELRELARNTLISFQCTYEEKEEIKLKQELDQIKIEQQRRRSTLK